MAFFSWIMIIILVLSVNFFQSGRRIKENRTRTQGAGINRQRPPVQNKPRSFAAMPDQKKAVPNVENNCSAEDHHKFENNLSRFVKKRPNAIPNVPNSHTRVQPKMSGNRRTAMQLYIGDHVPQGMRAVKCGYCAADNLVPYGHGNEYKCYFCHYDI